MEFVLIEVIFRYEYRLVTLPVVSNEGLFCVLNCLENSDKVVAFKVIDTQPVLPKHFGYGADWNKWVMTFTQAHFGGKNG